MYWFGAGNYYCSGTIKLGVYQTRLTLVVNSIDIVLSENKNSQSMIGCFYFGVTTLRTLMYEGFGDPLVE